MVQALRHERVMPFHGPIEGSAEKLGVLLDFRRKRNEPFGRDEPKLAADRFIDKDLWFKGIKRFSEQSDVQKMHSHAPCRVWNLTGRRGAPLYAID